MKSKINRIVSLFLAAVVLLGAYVPVALAADTPFDDVPRDAWFAEAVAWAVPIGVTTGTSPTTFSPNYAVTRGEFVTFLYRVAGEPSVSFIPRFDDVVNPTRFFFRAVQWAAAVEITTGFGGTNEFRPYNPITREELATMLFRFARIRDDDLTVSPGILYRFPDRNNISGFAVESMGWAATQGVVRGDRGRLMPQGRATRAEALTMLYRHVENVPFTLPPVAGFDHGSVIDGVTIGAPAAHTDNDRLIWNFFRDRGLSPQATAGMMGNLFAESSMRPNIVERRHRDRVIQDNNWPALTNAELDARYTEAVNTGTYRTSQPQTHLNLIPHVNPIDSRNSFIFDRVGYGLSQWTYPTRKRNMYDFIRARGGTFDISCLDAQLDFIWNEITVRYPSIQRDLNVAACVFEASNLVLDRYKIPADRGPVERGRRAGFSLGYFNRFVG